MADEDLLELGAVYEGGVVYDVVHGGCQRVFMSCWVQFVPGWKEEIACLYVRRLRGKFLLYRHYRHYQIGCASVFFFCNVA